MTSQERWSYWLCYPSAAQKAAWQSEWTNTSETFWHRHPEYARWRARKNNRRSGKVKYGGYSTYRDARRQKTESAVPPCALCLRKLGFGMKYIAKQFGVGAWVARSYLKIKGVWHVDHKKRNGGLCSAGRRKKSGLNPAIWQRRAWEREWPIACEDHTHKSAKRCSECRTWKHVSDYYDTRMAYCKRCECHRWKRDPQKVVRRRLRLRLYHLLRRAGAKKSDRTMALIGCTAKELANWIQSKFNDGMGWHNAGEWQIDHIRPCASFNLLNPEEQRACFHYSNLQPLWARENLAKSDSLNWAKTAYVSK